MLFKEIESPEEEKGPAMDVPDAFPEAFDKEEDTARDDALSGFAYLWFHRRRFLAVMDFLFIISCLMFSYYLRFRTDILCLGPGFHGHFMRYFTAAFLLAGLWVLIHSLLKGYTNPFQGGDEPLKQLLKLIISGFAAICTLMIYFFFELGTHLSRAVYVITAISAVPLMLMGRFLFRSIERDLSEMKVEVVRVLIAGLSGQSRILAERFASGSSLIRFLGFVGIDGEGEIDTFHNFPVLGTFSDIPALYEKHPFEMLIIFACVFTNDDRSRTDKELFHVLNFCELNNVSLLYDLSHTDNVTPEKTSKEHLVGLSLPGAGVIPGPTSGTDRSKMKRALIIGFNSKGKELVDRINSTPEPDCQVLGFISSNPQNIEKKYGGVSVIGDLTELKENVDMLDIHEVIVALGSFKSQVLMDLVAITRGSQAETRIIPGMDESGNGKGHVSRIHNFPLLPISPQILRHRDLFLKRTVDILTAIVGLTLVVPFFPLIALAIKLDSSGPLVYRQERVGRFGKAFNIYKFRTMHTNAEQGSGPTWSKKNDPRITPVGRFLRRSRLDEVPQLWNILINDMSFVGPRPERPYFVDQLMERFPLYRYRLKMKPGLTGWAQVKGKYDESLLDVERKLLLDFFYMENFSLRMDLKILVNTVKVILAAEGQ